MIEIVPMRDIIYDERGNYYIVTQNAEDKLVLLNAYVDKAYSRIFISVDKSYEHKYIGNWITDMLLNRLENLKREEVPGGIYSLDEIKQYYRVEFIDTAEYTQMTLATKNNK